jgi:HD superfamily phosphohydrolase YqeK
MFSVKEIREMKENIIKMLRETNRPGMENLIQYMEKKDFSSLPAAIKHHHNYLGGWSKHALEVEFHLAELNDAFDLKLNPTTISIVSLLHDLCKLDDYVYDENHLNNDGSVGGFTWNEAALEGHSKKSIFTIKQFIDLTEEEEVAIMCHMGPYSREVDWTYLSDAYKKYPLAYYLHVADMKSTYGI